MNVLSDPASPLPGELVQSHVQRITTTGGRLNARSALGASEFLPDSVAPDAVSDLLSSGVTGNSISLIWTATGDNGSAGGPAYLYDVRYQANNPITESNWESALTTEGEPLPQAAGSTDIFTITNLAGRTTYHVALKVTDDAGNISLLSNDATATTDTAPGGAWSVEIVDSEGFAGFYNSLAYDSLGNPSIGYAVDETGRGKRYKGAASLGFRSNSSSTSRTVASVRSVSPHVSQTIAGTSSTTNVLPRRWKL